MQKPKISPQFTVDDIHRIREYHYELTKNMSFEERRDFYKEKADAVMKQLRNSSRK